MVDHLQSVLRLLRLLILVLSNLKWIALIVQISCHLQTRGSAVRPTMPAKSTWSPSAISSKSANLVIAIRLKYPHPRNSVDLKGYCPSIPAESQIVLSFQLFCTTKQPCSEGGNNLVLRREGEIAKQGKLAEVFQEFWQAL